MAGLADIAKLIKQEAKERAKTPGDRFVEAMDKYLTDVDQMNSLEVQQFYVNVLDTLLEGWGVIDNTVIPPYFHFRASSAGACKRSWFYAAIGAEKDRQVISALSRRKLDNGTFAHLRLQCYVAHMIWLGTYGVHWPGYSGIRWSDSDKPGLFWELFRQYVEMETYKAEGNHSGHIDMQVEFMGTVYNVDFKTVLHETRNGVIGFKDLHAPHDEYVAQVTSYAIQTGVLNALIVYESKETQELKAFHVFITPTMMDDYNTATTEIAEKARRWKLGDTTVLETIPFELSKCWRCAYKTRCTQDGRPTPNKVFGGNAVGG